MTIPARDEDTPFQSGDGDTVERREREAVRDQIARLKRHLKIRIQNDAMDKPKSPYSLMPARAIAQRLSASGREEFWTALEQSIRDGAFDAAPPVSSRRLYVFNDCPLLRLTSDVFDDIAEIDGPDSDGVSEYGYLKNAWASIQTWRAWCPNDRFLLPSSWDGVIAERDRQRSKSIALTDTQPHGLTLRQVDAQEAKAILLREVAQLTQNSSSQILARNGAQYHPSTTPGGPTLREIVKEVKPPLIGRPRKTQT